MKLTTQYSNPEELEIFENQTIYFAELRQRHGYGGANTIKEMLDFCNRKNLLNIKKSLNSINVKIK